MRKLATIRKINKITPIIGADAIETATVDGWNVVVKKGEFEVGDLVVYFEIDSFLPICEEFEFLRKSSYKKMGEDEGFRLKTIKLRGQVSQGLIIPIPENCTGMQEGTDVTEILGVKKYEPPIPAQLEGKVKGGFPSFIVKTDEERVQNMEKDWETKIRGKSFFVSEKLDGTSFTAYVNGENFGVCSRNLELDLGGENENSYIKTAKALDLENKMKSIGFNFAIQGELIGEGIQKNPYNLKGQHLYVFNVFDIDKYEYVSKQEMVGLCSKMGLNIVPTISTIYTIPNVEYQEGVRHLLDYAVGKSLLNKKTEREGLVWVSNEHPRVSFKTISNKFLLKNDE